MSGLDRTFSALADETRRKVVTLLLDRPRRAGELAEKLKLTPAAMSKQLKVLRDGGLVEPSFDDSDARARTYQLKPERFAEAHDWLADFERFWTLQLGAFKKHMEKKKR